MEGYHSMDRMLAQHMFSLENDLIPFPPVAGYAGTTHLYKVKLNINYSKIQLCMLISVQLWHLKDGGS